MGSVGIISPAAHIAGIFYSDIVRYENALPELTGRYGPVAFESPEYAFTMTEYYKPEMGEGLRKRFICFERPMELDSFPAVKVFTNSLERKYAASAVEGFNRSINIDPGYVTLAKLVLASTKNFSHRIYIGSGIYGEITLYYRKGTFHPLATTFPDYKTPLALEFFNRVRDYVKENRDEWIRGRE